MAIRQRLRSLLWRVPIDQEVRDELAHHLELRTQELIARGLAPADARAEAERRLEAGRVATELKRLGRGRNDAWARRERLDELRQDLSFAFRQCRSKPGFAIATVLTLALGLGATTSIFSVVHAVVLKPYAYADPDRVLVAFSMFRGNRGSWSVGNYNYFNQRLTTTAHFAAAATTSFNLADEGQPERVLGRRVTWTFFPLFGIHPAYGRTFTADEDRPQGGVVVLSDCCGGGASTPTARWSGARSERESDVVGAMPPEFEEIGDARSLDPDWVYACAAGHVDEFYMTAYAHETRVTLACG